MLGCRGLSVQHRASPAPITPLLGRREGSWMPFVYPEVIFPSAVLAALPVNASVMKTACQTRRQGVRGCAGEQPGAMKMELLLTLLPSAEGPLQMATSAPLCCIHQPQPDVQTSPLLPRQEEAVSFSPPRGEPAAGLAVKQSTKEAPQCPKTTLVSGYGEPSSVMLVLAIT